MSGKRWRRRPATSDEGRESQLVTLAMDLAERQLAEGTASSQVITHYLKLGSTRERLEQERISKENELLESKVEMLASQQRIESLYSEALNAMRSYAGHELEQTEEEDYGYDDQNVY